MGGGGVGGYQLTYVRNCANGPRRVSGESRGLNAIVVLPETRGVPSVSTSSTDDSLD